MSHTRHTSDRLDALQKTDVFKIIYPKMIASLLNESIILVVVFWPETTSFSMCLPQRFLKVMQSARPYSKQMAIWSSLFVVATVAVSAPQLPQLAEHEQCFAGGWLRKH